MLQLPGFETVCAAHRVGLRQRRARCPFQRGQRGGKLLPLSEKRVAVALCVSAMNGRRGA